MLFRSLGRAALGTLAHELGHNFGLLHTDAQQVGERNVMAPGRKTGLDTYTEGQIFRIHFAAGSALSAVYGRNAELRRACNPNSLGDASCPPVIRMVRVDPSLSLAVHAGPARAGGVCGLVPAAVGGRE